MKKQGTYQNTEWLKMRIQTQSPDRQKKHDNREHYGFLGWGE